MDRLDIISAVILFGLISALVYHSVDLPDEVRIKKGNVIKMAYSDVRLNESAPMMKTLKNLIDAGNLEKAKTIAEELQSKYPYAGDIYMIKGDIMMREQDPIGAVYAFREAVDLNPDFVDKKTPDFQGYKIKVAIEETRELVSKKLLNDPGDGDAKKARKTMYYLLRRLAGSCG